MEEGQPVQAGMTGSPLWTTGTGHWDPQDFSSDR